MEILLFIFSIIKFLVLGLLSVVGIVLLLVLLIVLIIFHTPFRHKVIFRFNKESGNLYLHFNLNWFFKFLEVDVYYKDKELQIKHKIIKEKKEDVKDGKKSKKTSKKDSKKKGNNGTSSKKQRDKAISNKEKNLKHNPELVRQKSVEKASKTKKETEAKRKQESESNGHLNKSIEGGETDNKCDEKHHGSSKRSKDKSKTSGERYQDALAKVQEIEYYIWIFTDPKIMRQLKKVLKSVFAIFKMDMTVFYGKYGCSDYEKLGKILAGFYVVKGWYSLENFMLEGDFEKECLDVTLYTKGKIKLYTIVYPVIVLGYYIARAELKRRNITFLGIIKNFSNKFYIKLKKKKTHN